MDASPLNYSLRDEAHVSNSWMYQMGSEDVLKELKVEPILDYICRYQNWREHVNRMSRTRVPKAIMYHQPRGKRSLGRLMKRWHEDPLLRS
jgi:hypothetical protein